MADGDPAPVPRRKRAFVIVWAVVVLVAAMCFLGAIAGPKFASFHARSTDALAGDAGAP